MNYRFLSAARFRAVLLGAALSGAVLLAVSAAAAPPSALHMGANTLRLAQPNIARFPSVTLFAYPTDARGVRIGGLRPDSFQVTENGAPAEIVKVESEGGNIDVCLALDRSPSMLDENKLGYAKDAAREFLRQLAPDDQAALITFSNGSTLDQGLTRQHDDVIAAIDRTQVSGNTTTFMDAVYWSITQVGLRPQGGSVVGASTGRADARRVVLALTDGNDRASRVLPQELIDYARTNGVALCMVALGADASGAQMQYFSEQTGGVYMRAPSPRDLQTLYVALAQQLRQEYRITYRTPRPQPDGSQRAVHVSLVSQPVVGDTAYQAPTQGSLLGTGNSSDVSGASATATAGAAGGPDAKTLITGTLLMVLGLGGVLVALFYWLGTRRRTLNIVDSNPRLDLLPLWVREGSTRVGRGAECELVLDSRQVSRVHAVIEAIDGCFRLLDEGSRNGTFVNGRRVRKAQELRIGDVIRFGDREFRFAGTLHA